MQIKRGSTIDWSLGPEIVHFEDLLVNGKDSTIECLDTIVRMNVYTESMEKFYSNPSGPGPATKDSTKTYGLWIKQDPDTTVWFSDPTKNYRVQAQLYGAGITDCHLYGVLDSRVVELTNYPATEWSGASGEPKIWVSWPNKKSTTAEIKIKISVKEVDAGNELKEGQLGLEYTENGQIRLKAGMPDIKKWNQLPYITSVADPYRDYQSDVPKNEGVLNAILNMKQICEIITEPIKTMYLRDNTEYSEPFSGLPYTSSVGDGTMVPIYAPLERYISGLRDPNHPAYRKNMNGYPAYGSSCSASISYALNLPAAYPSQQFPQMSDFIEVPFKTIELGDIAWREGHVAMVVDITRNQRGRIGEIVTSELTDEKAHYQTWSYNELTTKYERLYRYDKIYNVLHTPSEYVPVEDEILAPPVVNTEYSFNGGNKNIYSYETTPIELTLYNTNYANGIITITNTQGAEIISNNIPNFDEDIFLYQFQDASGLLLPGQYVTTITNNDGTLISPYHDSFMVISTKTNLNYDAASNTLSVCHEEYDQSFTDTITNPNGILPSIVRWSTQDNGTSYISILENFNANHIATVPVPEFTGRSHVWVSIGYTTPYGTIFTDQRYTIQLGVSSGGSIT